MNIYVLLKKMKKIILLVDYRSQYFSSTLYKGASLNIKNLIFYFKKLGYKVDITHFYQIDLRNKNYKNQYILYQSSEDPNLLYKEYIEDVLLALELQGAILVPEFKYFRAHHNKVFMEFLRDVSLNNDIKNLISNCYGTYEEYLADSCQLQKNTFVCKSSSGSKSSNVYLVSNRKQRLVIPKKISKSFTFTNFKYTIELFLKAQWFLPISNYRKKFIIQNFIPELEGDYRVIVYGNRYYVLYRKNRKNDFRASGSGLFFLNPELPVGLLDFAKNVYKSFNVPFMSMDIGCKDGVFYLFEFQFVSFGQYTIEKSIKFYFLRGGVWNTVFEKPDVEKVLTEAVVKFINYRYKK